MRRSSALVAALVLAAALAACGRGPETTAAPSSVPPSTASPTVGPTSATPSATPSRRHHAPRHSRSASASPAAGPVRVVAVGDIACPPGGRPTPTSCQQAATAALTASLHPEAILVLGDLQYERGSAAEFASYDASWGKLSDVTHAVPGNHEYLTSNAAPFFAHEGLTAPGYRAIDVGSWRVYLLNSNCGPVDCGVEAAWLDGDLRAHPHRCSLLAMHYPRFSSGVEHGSNPGMNVFWDVAYRRHVDVAVAGHEHDYERFAALTPDGSPAPGRGIVSFVSGLGGRSLYDMGSPIAGSQHVENHHFAVLELTLGDGTYSWRLVAVGGGVLDRGAADCV